MVTALQAVSSVNTVSLPPPVTRVSVLTTEAGTSFAVPSTIVSLGASSAVTDFLAYNAAGLFGSSLQLNESNQAAASNPDTTVTPAVDAQLRAATDLTAEATAVEPALETLIALPATAASAIAPGAPATSTAAAAATLQIHPAAQALNNISGNPAYAFAAAGMYLSAVISRMQPITATTRPASAADAPQPVTPVRRIMPI